MVWFIYNLLSIPFQWFTSTDPQGKIYFYEENSSQSSWFLPEVQAAASGGETLQVKKTTSGRRIIRFEAKVFYILVLLSLV